jgi:hypothetical protein
VLGGDCRLRHPDIDVAYVPVAPARSHIERRLGADLVDDEGEPDSYPDRCLAATRFYRLCVLFWAL